MGFTLFSIVIGAVSLILYILFPLNISEWFIWGIYMLMSIFYFVKSFTEYNSMLKGEPKSDTDLMGMASFPFTTSIMFVVLIIFLFVDISKFHLLWLYSIVAIIFDLTIGKRAGLKARKNFEL